MLSGLQQAALPGRVLASGAAVSFAISPAGLVVTLSGAAPDPDGSAVALGFSGAIKTAQTAAARMTDGTGGTPLDPSGGTPLK